MLVLVVGLCFILASWRWLGSSCFWPTSHRTITLSLPHPDTLSDTEAVDLSREALRMAVADFAGYDLATFDGTNYFARNGLDPRDGYVLWRSKTKRFDGYSVGMTQRGTNVVCEVGRTH